MKRTTISGFIGAGILVSAALFWFRGTLHAQVPMNVKGLGEHGTELVAPGDPSFEALKLRVLKGRRNPMADAAGSLAVILNNKSQKGIVAYALIWESTRVDGKRFSRIVTAGQPNALLDGGQPFQGADVAQQRVIVRRGEARYFAYNQAFGESEGSSFGPALAADLESPSLSAKADALREHWRKDLADKLNVTVKLDGVFFEDGTFVGPDESGFFEMFRAQVDAKQDLLLEIVRAQAAGTSDRLLSELRKNGIEKVELSTNPGKEESYRFFRRLGISEILSVWNATGFQGVVSFAREEKYKIRPVLKKGQGGGPAQ